MNNMKRKKVVKFKKKIVSKADIHHIKVRSRFEHNKDGKFEHWPLTDREDRS